MCPGTRSTLSCSVEQSSIQWRIWCDCRDGTIGSCRDTCTLIPTHILNTRSGMLNGSLCGNSSITYDNSFMIFTEENRTSVTSSDLSITIPLQIHHQNTIRLCLTCLFMAPRYIQILGTKLLYV